MKVRSFGFNAETRTYEDLMTQLRKVRLAKPLVALIVYNNDFARVRGKHCGHSIFISCSPKSVQKICTNNAVVPGSASRLSHYE
jgi:hypothetical protein